MITLEISKDIYSQNSLDAAVLAYKGFAEINVLNMGQKWRLTFDKCLYDESMTAREFENYMICLENQNANN